MPKEKKPNSEGVTENEKETHDFTSQYPSSWRLFIVLLSLSLGTLLMAIDTTIISVAIPKISTEFNALGDVGWYGSGYLITLTAFQPVTGNAYRMFHPKMVYLASIAVFEVGSTLCAAAPSSVVFILGRVFAGVGAAGILQGALGILTYISPLEKRPFYMSIVVSVFGISMCAAPVIGGVLTDKASWRWCFWINLPLGAVVSVLVIMFLKIKGIEKAHRAVPLKAKLQRMDPIGILTIIGAVSCLFLALQFGGASSPWKSALVIGLFIGFGLLLAVFGVLQWKLGENATIPFRFLRQRTVVMGSMFLFCINMANYIQMYYLPFYFQSVRGASTIRSGVNYIPLAAAELVGIMVSGALISKTGHYIPFILIGQIICAIGSGLLILLGVHTSTALWATYLVLTGFGVGMGINAPHVAIQAVFTSESDVFIANGVATFFSQLGGSISTSIGASFLLNGLNHEVPKVTQAISTELVISSGPLAVTSLAKTPEALLALRIAYAAALKEIWIFAVVIVCVSIPMACGMEWLNLKKVTQEKETTGEDITPGIESISNNQNAADNLKVVTEKNEGIRAEINSTQG